MATEQATKQTTKKPVMFFGGHGTGFPKAMRVVASVTAAVMAWIGGPMNAFAKKPTPITPYSRLTEKGLTQTPDAALQAKIAAKEAAAKRNKPVADVRPLSGQEMQAVRGSGPYRNAYLAGGPMPWHRSFHDVNMCTGNLFKSFTDFQIAPGRGAGLVLQRTYSSEDERVGPFGVGWTHAYDIRMEEAGIDPTTDAEIVPRTDFFGGKHDYKRDADGLYSPPAYLFDEMDSKYDDQLANGPSQPLEDTQKGMDGTVKHFITNETVPVPANAGPDFDPVNHNVRVCDYIEDRHGNRTNLVYNQTITLPDGSTKKLLTSVTDPVGRSLTFTWANLGTTSQPAYRITQVDGPSGTYSVTYDYNSDLNLSAVHMDVNGLNRTTTFGYTSCAGETGLLASIADPLGHTLTYDYDSDEWRGVVYVRRLSEPSTGGLPHYWYFDRTERTPGRRDYCVVENGRPPLPSGAVPYSDNIYLIATVLFDQNSLRAYQSEGDFLYDPAPGFYEQYDTSNNVTISHIRTAMFQYGYGSDVEQVRTYGPHGNVLTSRYRYPNGGFFPGTETTTYFNASKYFQKASSTNLRNRTSSFDYFDDQDVSVGNRGEVKWVRDAGYSVVGSPSYGQQFEYTYNQYGQKLTEKNLNGVITQYTYGDSWGNLTSVVQDPGDPAQGHLNRTTQMTYDVSGRVLSSTDPNGKTSTFTYNNLGQPTSASLAATTSGGTTVTPAETVSYTYGANGRTATVTDNRGTTLMTYESGNDRVSSVTDPVTGTISYTYLTSGARKTMTLPGATSPLTYQYQTITPSGFPLSTGISGHTFGCCLASDDPNSIQPWLDKIIDDEGRMVDTGRIIDDGWGGQETMNEVRQLVYNATYNTNGELVSYLKKSYLTDELIYNEDAPYIGGMGRNWLRQMTTTFNTKLPSITQRVVSQNDYTLDNGGLRTSNTISSQPLDSSGQPATQSDGSPVLQSRTENYTYDDLSRLKTVNYGDGQTQTYAFDAMGNRTAKTDNVTGNETYGFNNANMLTSRSVGGSGSTYSNDTNGNTLSGGGRVNTWDSQNRLVKVVKNGVTSEFTYGWDGLRRRSLVTKANGEQTRTDYVIDGQGVVQEVVKNRASATASWGNATTVSYLQGPQGPLYRHVSGTTDVSWYVYDGLGSVVGEVDVTGNLTSTKDHDVYGLTRSITGTPTSRHGFVGQLGHTEDDETGFIYMRARHYDPEIGRFASEDPAGNGNNWYIYCGNNPVNKSDFSGKVEAYLVQILGALMQMVGIEMDAWDCTLLLGASSAQFGAALFGRYTTALLFKRGEWLKEANEAMKNRLLAEGLGMEEEAGIFARVESYSRGQATTCLIITAMFPMLWAMSWIDEI